MLSYTSSGGFKNFEKGRKTIYQLRPRTTKYMPFTRKKRLFVKKKYEPMGGRLPPAPLPFKSATVYKCYMPLPLNRACFDWPLSSALHVTTSSDQLGYGFRDDRRSINS